MLSLTKPKEIFKMKRLLLLVTLSVFCTGIFAQGGGVAPLMKGDKQINFGVGFSTHGVPVYFDLDFAIHKDITLTPELHAVFPFPGHSFRGGFLFKADYHWNYLIGIPRNFDFYAGARVGLSFGDDLFPEFGVQVGGRWYWSERWGMNAEFGFGTGFGATFGLSYIL